MEAVEVSNQVLILIGYCFKINFFLKSKNILFWHQTYIGLIIHTNSSQTSKIIVTLIYVCLHEVGRKTGILQNVICRTETIDDDAAQQSPPLKTGHRQKTGPQWFQKAKTRQK